MARMHQALDPPTSLRSGLLHEQTLLRASLDAVVDALEGGDARTITDAWMIFDSSLVAHLDAEDGQLISFVPHERSWRLLAHEHRHIRMRLDELRRALERQELRRGPLIDLRDVLHAHARNDDRLLYTWAEAELVDPHRAAVLLALEQRLARLVERQRQLRDAMSDSITVKNSSTFTGFVK